MVELHLPVATLTAQLSKHFCINYIWKNFFIRRDGVITSIQSLVAVDLDRVL